jgi:hypothetical protein
MNPGLLDSLPMSGVYSCVVLLILLSFEAGYQISNRARTPDDKDTSSTLGPMVGGILGMLAFVLAFTFSTAASQYNLRKQAVLDEANAINTAYLRADLIDEQYRAEVKSLLRDYVNTRLQGVKIGHLKAAIARSIELHKLLWVQVSSAAKTTPTINTSLLVQSINNVINMHEKRVTAAIYNRIPDSIWLMLLATSILTMVTVGTQVGFSMSRRLIAIVPLALAFAALTTVIVDLDRPQTGLIKVGQQAMISLQSSMNHDIE